MIFVFLALPIVAIAGYLIGIFYRNLRIKQIQADTLQKPEYDVQDKLTPAEFCLLMKGRVDKNAFMGEIIQLQNMGYLELNETPSGQITAAKTNVFNKNIQPLQQELISAMFSRQSGNVFELKRVYLLIGDLKFYTRQSLIKKGWIEKGKPHLTLESTMPRRFLIREVASIILFPLLAFFAGKATGIDGEDLFVMPIMAAVAVLVSSIIVAFYIHFKDYFRRSASHTLHVTEKYRTDYEASYGLYIYMKVSGMDTMTPDRETLNFKQLDKLYPYAVATGLDPAITKLLIRGRHQKATVNP